DLRMSIRTSNAVAGTSEQPPGQARPCRSRVHLSLRALMAVILFIAAALGWAAYRARLQRQAVDAIKQAGGKVYYAGQHLDGSQNPPPASGIGALLHQWILVYLPDDYWRFVEMVDLEGTDAGDAVLAHFGALDRLDFLNLGHTKVTDAGLAHLK